MNIGTSSAPERETNLSVLTPVSEKILTQIAEEAGAVDCGDRYARDNMELLADAGVLGLGAPSNANGELASMASVISSLSAECMSTAFAVWASRMTVEYLTIAATPWARAAASEIVAGQRLGVTGMASAFKEAAGCGALDLTAEPLENGGYSLSGTLRWASNLYTDSIMVTAARTPDDDRIILGLPLSTPGVQIGAHFDLLALDGTASSFVTLDKVNVPESQILSREFMTFIGTARPTFLTLQTSMCLGLAARCIDQAKKGATGINEIFEADINVTDERIDDARAVLMSLAQAVSSEHSPSKTELLSLRLRAAELSTAAAGLEIRTAGGKGYSRRTDASRRFREAAFIPVQSPSESQLRWELEACSR